MTTRGSNITQKLARISLFTGFGAIGSFLSIPSPVSSVALDSAGGYFCALNFTTSEGLLVLFLGHLVTGLVHGFPLGLLHLPIAIGLGVQGWIMVKTAERLGHLPSTIVGIGINTALTLIVIPFFGIETFFVFVPIVFTGSLINGVIAYLATRAFLRLRFDSMIKEQV